MEVFRCCANPIEVELVLDARMLAGDQPVRLAGCRRCGVVYFRERAVEFVPDQSSLKEEPLACGWYLVEGVRYCSRCRSRRCVRQEGGSEPCPSPEHAGFYRIYWKEGGSSLAAVGGLHSGERWYAPLNWSGEAPSGIASKNWRRVDRVEPVVEVLPRVARDDEKDERLVVSDAEGRYRVSPVTAGPEARWEGNLGDDGVEGDVADEEEAPELGEDFFEDPVVTRPGESLIEKIAVSRAELVGCDDCGMEIEKGSECGNPACASHRKVSDVEEIVEDVPARGSPYLRLSVEGGKYNFRLIHGDWRIHIDRYSVRDWVLIDGGAKAVCALMGECDSARAKIASLKAQLAALQGELVESEEYVESLQMQLTSSQGEVAKLRAQSVDWKNTEGRGGRED